MERDEETTLVVLAVRVDAAALDAIGRAAAIFGLSMDDYCGSVLAREAREVAPLIDEVMLESLMLRPATRARS